LQPTVSLNGRGGGSGAENWEAGGAVGVGVKVYQSENGAHSIGLGAAATQATGRTEVIFFIFPQFMNRFATVSVSKRNETLSSVSLPFRFSIFGNECLPFRFHLET
jgi:hypothetical protein